MNTDLEKISGFLSKNSILLKICHYTNLNFRSKILGLRIVKFLKNVNSRAKNLEFDSKSAKNQIELMDKNSNFATVCSKIHSNIIGYKNTFSRYKRFKRRRKTRFFSRRLEDWRSWTVSGNVIGRVKCPCNQYSDTFLVLGHWPIVSRKA